MGVKTARSADDVHGWLETQGYRLEHEAAIEFKKAGFKARLAQPYRDPIEDKVREIDVLAHALLKSALNVTVVAECKAATTGAWLVRCADISTAASAWTPIGTEALTAYLTRHPVILREALPFAQPVGFHVVEAAPQDGAYAAINQAISGAIAVASIEGAEHSMVYPVVVVDGPLFLVMYGDDLSERVEPTGSYRVLWSASRALSGPTAVDIVQRQELPSWASRLRSELGELVEFAADFLDEGRSLDT